MTPIPSAVVASILLGLLSQPAAAIDPATISAVLTLGERTHVLSHALAWQARGQAAQLWIYLTDAELPLAVAQQPDRVRQLVGEGRLRGVLLVVDAARPDPKKLRGTLLHPVPDGYRDMPSFRESRGAAGWRRLVLGDRRVVGSLFVNATPGQPVWSLDAQFSAPVFGGGAGGPRK